VKKIIGTILALLGVLVVAFAGWFVYELATWDEPVKVSRFLAVASVLMRSEKQKKKSLGKQVPNHLALPQSQLNALLTGSKSQR